MCDKKIDFNSKEASVLGSGVREVNITLAEFRELVEAKKELEMVLKVKELQNIVDTLKNNATLEDGRVFIFIPESKKDDRDFIVKAMGLKEEENPNE